MNNNFLKSSLCVFLLFPLFLRGAEKDKEVLLGKWKVIGFEFRGQEQKEFWKNLRIDFEKDRVKIKFNAIEIPSEYTLEVSEVPRHIDLIPATTKRTIRGIYRFSDQTLTICLDISGTESRPTKFRTNPDSFAALLRLTRDKD